MDRTGPKPLVISLGSGEGSGMTELRALASPGDDGVRTTLGPLARFRVQAARRASGRVLDIGARRLSDLPDYQYLGHLALVEFPSEVSESDLPLRAEKIDADAEHLPFPDRSFDAVVCRFALSRAANPALAAREIARVLRWKGHLLFLEAAGDARRVDPVTHLRISGLVTHDIERTRTRAHPRWLVQGIATHPSAQYEREIAWLLGTARGGNHDDEESSGLPQGSQ